MTGTDARRPGRPPPSRSLGVTCFTPCALTGCVRSRCYGSALPQSAKNKPLDNRPGRLPARATEHGRQKMWDSLKKEAL